MQDPRYDFRSGLVTAISSDLLNANELPNMQNARLIATGGLGAFGSITKRPGSQRFNDAALNGGSAITALAQWDAPGGKQVVAIAGGKLHYRTALTPGSFTQVVPGTLFSTTLPQSFAAFRNGSALNLYIGDSGVLYRWDGAALTLLTAAGGALDNADLLVAYHTRLFAHQPAAALTKNATWSKVGNPESFTSSGLTTDGGSAMVDVLNGEKIVAFDVIGSSLLMASNDSISRLTGYSNDDIRIDSDTEGLSSEVGVVGPLALRRFETAAALLANRGPYAVTEGGVSPIGSKIIDQFRNAVDLANISKASIAYNRNSRELWFFVPLFADGGTPKTVYAYNIDLQAWMGPWIFPFTVTCSCSAQDASGRYTVLTGSSDGYVRAMEFTALSGVLDDVTSIGTGGSNISMLVIPAPHFFDTGLAVAKSAERMLLDVDPVGGIAGGQQASLIVSLADESGSLVAQQTVTGSGRGVQRVDLNGYGKKFTLSFADSTNAQVTIYGYTIYAFDMKRRD
jgi:hypothetical protein